MADDEPEDALLSHLDTYYAAEIAYAISAWAKFEYEIDELIWMLAGMEKEEGACVTAHQSLLQKFDALLALGRLQKITAKNIIQLNTVRVNARGLSEERNRLVHDPWFYGYLTKAHYRLQRTAKSKLEHRYKRIEREEIEALRAKIEKLTSDFSEVATAVSDDFYSSYRKST